MLKGKAGRLLRKGAMSLAFAAAALTGAALGTGVAAMFPGDTQQTSATLSTPRAAPVPGAGVSASDPDAAAATSAVFNYLAGLSNQSGHRLVSGQWAGYGSVVDAEIQGIDKLTGQRVGLVGADYLDFNGPRINYGNVNASMINYWKQGSLVDIDVHFPNPWTGGGPQDMTVGNFTDVITPGTAAYKAYMANLDTIATGLQQLQDAGVVVLFRPMMEMDGNWFWWAQQPAFPKLWAQTVDYLTTTKGLHNLLWVYSAGAGAPMAYYPGSQYVDVVGYDAYGYRGGKVAGYKGLLATGKPFALTEFGLQSANASTRTDPPRDLHAAIRKIQRDMPAAVYFMAWSNAKGASGNYWSIDAQLNAKAALNDPNVQNGPVPWNAAVASVQPPPPPTSP